MAMSAERELPIVVALQFGSAIKEASLTSAEYSELQGAIQDKFGLDAGSFSIRDGCGKVESGNWARALQMAAVSKQDFLLKIEQSAEWKKLSELEARLDKLTEGAVAASLGGTSLDEVVALVEKRLAGRVGELVESIHGDVRLLSSKLDALDPEVEDLRQRSMTFEAMLPVLESVATSDMALRKQLEGLELSVKEMKRDDLKSASFHPFKREKAASVPACVLDLVDANNEEKRHDNVASINSSDKDEVDNKPASDEGETNVQNISAQLQQQQQIQQQQQKQQQLSCQQQQRRPSQGPLEERTLELKDSSPISPNSYAKLFFNQSSSSRWLEGRPQTQYPLPELSPGSKARILLSPTGRTNRLDASFAPFLKAGLGRQMDRTKSRSLPHLPPV